MNIPDPLDTTVLVTGASGYVASHCVLQLLQKGYHVRGTLRTAARETQLRRLFARHIQADDRLSFVQVDLLSDAGWAEAAAGCDFVLHVASPFPLNPPKHENELIVPAVEGTQRVLRAAATAGVKRVVLTSSTAAIMQGHDDYSQTFDESHWSQVEKSGAYARSKTMAERAAWAFVEKQTGERPMEMATINPGFVMGPVMDGQQKGTSIEVVRRFMMGEYPGVARINWVLVDVRDVAAAHVAAMTAPEAAGKRYLCVAEPCSMKEVADILANHFAGQGYKIRNRLLPNFAVRLFALFDASARDTASQLGRHYHISNERIKRDLNWQPRPIQETLIAMAESLITQGIVTK